MNRALLETLAAWLADGEDAGEGARTHGHALLVAASGSDAAALLPALLARHERVTLVTALLPQEALARVEVRSVEWLLENSAACSVACAIVLLLNLDAAPPSAADAVAAAAACARRGSGTLTLVEHDASNRWAALPSIERALFGREDAPPPRGRGVAALHGTAVTTLLPALVEMPVLPASAWCLRGRALTDEGVRAAADSLEAALGHRPDVAQAAAALVTAMHWRSLCNVLPAPTAGGKTRANDEEDARPPIARIPRLLLPVVLRVTEVALLPQDDADAGSVPEPTSGAPAAHQQGRAGLGQVARSGVRRGGGQTGGSEWAALMTRPVLPPALGGGAAERAADPWFLRQRLGGSDRVFFNRGLVAHSELLVAWRARPAGVVPRASDAVLPADLDYNAILEALATPDGDGQGAPPLPHPMPLADIVELLGDAWETHWTEQRDEDEGWD